MYLVLGKRCITTVLHLAIVYIHILYTVASYLPDVCPFHVCQSDCGCLPRSHHPAWSPVASYRGHGSLYEHTVLTRPHHHFVSLTKDATGKSATENRPHLGDIEDLIRLKLW